MSSPREVLRKYYPKLVKDMTDVETVLDYLYSDRVISLTTMEALHREPDPQQKVRRLVAHVQKRCDSGAQDAYTNFLAALDRADNGHLADLLRKATKPVGPASSPRPLPQRSLSLPVPRPRVAQPVGRKTSESAVSTAQTSSTNTPAERRESSSRDGSDVFSEGSGDEREGSPPVSTPPGGRQAAESTTQVTWPAGTGARPKQHPPGTSERRKSTSSSGSDVFSTGVIIYPGSRDGREEEKPGEERRVDKRQTTPEATSTANLPGLRSDVTATMSDVTVATVELSLSDQVSAAPRPSDSLPAAPRLSAPRPATPRLTDSLPAAPRPSAPRPVTPRLTDSIPAAPRLTDSLLAAPRPSASLPLPAPAAPALPYPLPSQVLYTTKRTPVRVVGPSLGKRFMFRSRVKLSRPAGLAYHAGTDRLYVACRRSNQVVTCGTRGQDPRVLYEVSWPRDVAVSGDGERVYVAASSYLHILTASGELVRGVTSVPGGELGWCWAVACYQQQVAVLTTARVVIFSRDGDHVREWSLRDVDGSAMAVDGDGRLYITDGKTGAVIVYSWEGEFRERFGEVEMKNPWSSGICVDGDGHVCVSRYWADRVDVYGPDRHLLTSLGGEEGDAPGPFHYPSGLCLLPDGRLVVSDHFNNRLQIF